MSRNINKFRVFLYKQKNASIDRFFSVEFSAKIVWKYMERWYLELANFYKEIYYTVTPSAAGGRSIHFQ